MQTAQTLPAQLQTDIPGSIAWKIPLPVIVIAFIAALLHAAPFLIAQSQTPAGWSFTGNLNTSPDLMQYYVWARRTQQTGMLVDNTFTTEPNSPHLLVLLYFVVGQVSAWTGLTPELTYAYLGSFLAFLLIIGLFVVIRYFLKSSYQTWWVFLIILLGGGIGAHLKLLSRYGFVQDNFLLNRILVEGLWRSILFEDLRGHYVFDTLFDTHFLLLWLVTTAAIFSLYFALEKFSVIRVMVTALLFALTTLIHLYEGITLVFIALVVLFFFWRKGLARASMFATLAVLALAVLLPLGWQLSLYLTSGLPLPDWREVDILFSAVLLAFPVAWLIMAWYGLSDYWQSAGVKECFLLGWMTACLLITLSGPFYPYPTRGTLTLQIPVYLIAGSIYFMHQRRVAWWGVLLALFLLAPHPARTLENWWDRSHFQADAPHKFMNAEHQAIAGALQSQATAADVLVADEMELLWLAPRHPGKLYCGHFFLTVDYDQKCAAVENLLNSSDPAEQNRLLDEATARFLYISAAGNPGQFAANPNLTTLQETSVGTLFEYSRETSHVSP